MSDDVHAFLAERHPEQAQLALRIRAVVRRAEPDLVERVYRGWSGIGFRHPDGGYVCAIYPQADHVRLLFEHGVRLDDPDALLRGDGRQTRFVELTGDAAIDPPDAAIARLVRDAVAERLFRR